MTKKLDLRATRNVLAASISAIGLVGAAPVLAQGTEEVQRLTKPESEVSIGVLNISQGRYSFGDYNGMHKKGAHLNGDVRIIKRGDNNANYFEVEGSNLGLDSRNIRIRGGEQGNYGIKLDYDQIHKLWSDSYQTPFLGAGSTNLTLPAGWPAAAANTAGLGVTLTNNMRPFNIETERKSIALGLTKLLPGGWDVEVNYKHETKQGNRLIGGIIGSSGGNPRGAVLPEPVDYVTRQFDAIARYTSDNLQVQLAYAGSLFDDRRGSLVFQNAFGPATWAGNAAVGYPNGRGELGLPPDNQAHQISASLGYRLSKDTRLTSNFSIGRMTQDESYLPYTINALAVPTALPRSSLDGKVDTTHFDMKVTSRLTPKLNLLAVYRYDDRNNKTPQAQYRYIGGDSHDQWTNAQMIATPSRWDRVRTNLPGSSTKQQVEVELDYKMAAHTKLKAGYDFDYVKKTFEAITSEWEHTVKADVHQHFSDTVTGGLGYGYSDRNTSLYDGSMPFYQTFTPQFAAQMGAVSLQWDNNPFQKKFFLAPRSRDKVKAFLDFEPTAKVNVHLGLDYKNDNFKESYYGLKKSQIWAQHLDVNYVPSDVLAVHGFVTLDQSTSFMKSNTLAGGCGGKANPTNPACEWGIEMIDRGLTFGLGAKYKPNQKYELGAEYIKSSWVGKTNTPVLGATAGVGFAPLPDNTQKLDRIDLSARYQLEKHLSLGFKYIYERFRVEDWATQDVIQNTLANVIGTNQTVPNHSVHAIGVSLIYKFQ